MIRSLLAAMLGAALLAGATETSPALNLTDYRSELVRLAAAVQSLSAKPQTAESLRQSIPESWTIAEGQTQIEISTRFLRDALAQFQKATPDQKRVLLDGLQRRLAAMREESAAFGQASAAGPEMRTRLDRILAAPEFAGARPASPWEIWISKAMLWLDRWLSRAASRVPELPFLGRIFVWVVIALAVSVLALWFYHVARRPPVKLAREIIPFAPSAKSWRAWLAEADQAAQSGRWRDAVHLSYWAAVSYLESSGLWRPDRARTPREYLKAVPASFSARAVFAALTRRFEAAWYGGRSAAAADFRAACRELEKLGCR